MTQFQEYRSFVKQHFPPLLERIAREKPHAIVFTDKSARPFAVLARKLWKPLGLDKIAPLPKVLFVTHPDWHMPSNWHEDWKDYRDNVEALIDQSGLVGKSVVIFDEAASTRRTLSFLSKIYRERGVQAKTAVLSADSLGGHPAFKIDLVGEERHMDVITAPWDKLRSMELSKPYKSALASWKGGPRYNLDSYRKFMGEIAEEIIAEREQSKGS